MYKFLDEKGKHVHTFGGKPLVGTTTLINEMMPPPLHWWASGKALEKLGWTNPKHVSREEGLKIAADARKNIPAQEGYYDFLQECYRNHDTFKKEAGDWGKEKHFLIEQAVKEAIAGSGFLKEESYEDEAVERFAKWGRGKRFILSEAHVFSEFLWLGGIVDLVYEENEKYYLGDVKTAKSGLHPQQFIQMGLYDLQQGENGFRDAEGELLLETLPIEGYTVVPIPQDTKSGFEPKTYRNTKGLKDLGLMLVEGYKLKRELEEITK